MNFEYIILFLMSVCFTLGCWLSYDEEIKKSIWYFPLGIGLGIITSFFWYYICIIITEKNRLYVYSLIWEVVMVLIYYGMPILFFNVKLEKTTLLGAFLIISGIFVLKTK